MRSVPAGVNSMRRSLASTRKSRGSNSCEATRQACRYPWISRSLSAAPPPPAVPASVDLAEEKAGDEPRTDATAAEESIPAAEASEPVESDGETVDEAAPGEGDE